MRRLDKITPSMPSAEGAASEVFTFPSNLDFNFTDSKRSNNASPSPLETADCSSLAPETKRFPKLIRADDPGYQNEVRHVDAIEVLRKLTRATKSQAIEALSMDLIDYIGVVQNVECRVVPRIKHAEHKTDRVRKAVALIEEKTGTPIHAVVSRLASITFETFKPPRKLAKCPDWSPTERAEFIDLIELVRIATRMSRQKIIDEIFKNRMDKNPSNYAVNLFRRELDASGVPRFNRAVKDPANLAANLSKRVLRAVAWIENRTGESILQTFHQWAGPIESCIDRLLHQPMSTGSEGNADKTLVLNPHEPPSESHLKKFESLPNVSLAEADTPRPETKLLAGEDELQSRMKREKAKHGALNILTIYKVLDFYDRAVRDYPESEIAEFLSRAELTLDSISQWRKERPQDIEDLELHDVQADQSTFASDFSEADSVPVGSEEDPEAALRMKNLQLHAQRIQQALSNQK